LYSAVDLIYLLLSGQVEGNMSVQNEKDNHYLLKTGGLKTRRSGKIKAKPLREEIYGYQWPAAACFLRMDVIQRRCGQSQ
jgi:NNP family nitrate/nitrite transporter-like MFS transporter